MLQPKKPLDLSEANKILETETETERKPLDLSAAVNILKKKDESGSTSVSEKSASVAPKNGSLGGSGLKNNPFGDKELPGQLPTAPATSSKKNGTKSTVASAKRLESPKVEERGFFASVIDKLQTGSAQLGADLAAIPEFVYDVAAIPQNTVSDIFDIPWMHADSEKFKKHIGVNNAVKDYYKKQVTQLRETAKVVDEQYKYGIYDSFANGNYTDGFKQLTQSFAESLPATSSIMMGGAVTKAPQLLAASTVLFGAGKNEQLNDEHPDMNHTVRVANAMATGLAEGAFETIGSGSIGAAAKALVEREGKKKAVSILKDGLTDFYKEAIKKNPLAASMIGEGLSEWSTQVSQNAVDMATGVKDPDSSVFDGATDALLIGSFSGGVFGGGLKGLDKVATYQDNKQVKQNMKKIFEMQTSIDNSEVSEIAKEEMRNSIDQLVYESRKLVQRSVENVERLGTDDLETLKAAIGTIETTKAKATAIKEDKNLSKDTKNTLLSNLNSEYREAQETKNRLLQKAESSGQEAEGSGQPVAGSEQSQAQESLGEDNKTQTSQPTSTEGATPSVGRDSETINIQETVGSDATGLSTEEQNGGTETSNETAPGENTATDGDVGARTGGMEQEGDATTGVAAAEGTVTGREMSVSEMENSVVEDGPSAGVSSASDGGTSEGTAKVAPISHGKYNYTFENGEWKATDSDGNAKPQEKRVKRERQKDGTIKERMSDKQFVPDKVLDAHAESYDFTHGERAVDSGKVRDVSTWEEDVAEHSRNAAEIAETLMYAEASDHADGLDYVSRNIAEVLGDNSVERGSYERFGDRNTITFGLAKRYFSKKGKGKGLDQIAQEVEIAAYGDYDASNPRVTEQDIIDFILDNPKGADNYLKGPKNSKINGLKRAFKELTGLPAKHKYLEKAMSQEAEQRKRLDNEELLYQLSDEELLNLSNEHEQYREYEQQKTDEPGTATGADSENKETGGAESGVQSEGRGDTAGEETADGERAVAGGEQQPGAETGIAERIFNQDNVRGILDFLDEMKMDLNDLKTTLPFAPQVWNAFIDAVKLSVKAGNSIQKAIAEGVNALSNSGVAQAEIDGIVDFFTDKISKNADGHTEFYDRVDDLINQGKTKDEILDEFDTAKEKRQAENIYHRITSENISEEDAYDEVNNTFDRAIAELENKKPAREVLRSMYRNFVKSFTDRQYLAKMLLDKAGMKAVKNLIVNAHGASGRAKIQFEKAYDKIYKGLSRADRTALDKIIQAKRFIAIDEKRVLQGKGPVTHPGFIDKNKSEKFLSKLEKELGSEKYADLVERAEAYFATYQDLLDQMVDNGLISQESRDAMDSDYQPRVFLQYVTDFEGNLGTVNKGNQVDSGGLSSEQIKGMSDGDASSLVLNSEWLLANSLLARSKAMSVNNINKRFMTGEFQKAKKRFESLDPDNLSGDDKRFYKYFKELSSKVIDNPIIGTTDSGNPKYQFEKTPNPHFQKAYYYVDGVKHEFFMEKGLHESWFDNLNHFLSANAKEFISYASGSALVKGIATGNNPAFPIVNTPRDFMFTVTFSDQYSSMVPKAVVQVFGDAFRAVKEIRKGDSDVLKQYIEHGGAMDFLSSEGRLKKSSILGKMLDRAVSPDVKDKSKAIFDKVTLHKISAYSEMMFRLGIFQRSINNQLKELGLKDISEVTDKQQREDIYNAAVASARGILDFNQGGTITKDLESVIPYVNVAFQGGRVAATAFEKNPVGITSRVLQVAATASAIPIGISLTLISAMKGDDDEEKSVYEIYTHALEGISAYQKMRYINIVTPIKDENGEYMIIKIAKAQEMTPIMSVTDDIYNNMIRKMAGKDKKSAKSITKSALSTLNDNVMPVDVTSPAAFFTRNPAMKAVLSYTTGYDFFRDEPLSHDIGKVPEAVEGISKRSTEEFYKKLGEQHGLSPVRSKAFVESFITSPNTNPFVGMLYGGADAAVSDKDMKAIGKDLFESIYKSTGKRLIGYSSDFNRTLENKKELKEKIEAIQAENVREKVRFNKAAKEYANKELSKDELSAMLREMEPGDRKRMMNKVKDQLRFKDVDGTVLDIKYGKSAEEKALMIAHYYGDITDKSEDSKRAIRQMVRVKGILSPEVMRELKKLKEKTPD